MYPVLFFLTCLKTLPHILSAPGLRRMKTNTKPEVMEDRDDTKRRTRMMKMMMMVMLPEEENCLHISHQRASPGLETATHEGHKAPPLIWGCSWYWDRFDHISLINQSVWFYISDQAWWQISFTPQTPLTSDLWPRLSGSTRVQLKPTSQETTTWRWLDVFPQQSDDVDFIVKSSLLQLKNKNVKGFQNLSRVQKLKSNYLLILLFFIQYCSCENIVLYNSQYLRWFIAQWT